MRLLAATVAAFAVALAVALPAGADGGPRNVARALATERWGAHGWKALDTLVMRESGWDPCSVYPSKHDCGYRGSNSCGIPQAFPCPSAWRGDLWSTREAQVDWLLAYVARRYGNPWAALQHQHLRGWY